MLAVVITDIAPAQGTFIYDQQSALESTGGGIISAIQPYQPMGQSFIPTLSEVGFIRLKLSDSAINGLGATVYLNLRTNPIVGTVLASTDPVFMPDGFIGYPNFFFSNPTPVTPGTTYYFQPVVQSGDVWGITAYNAYNYANGAAYSQGVASPGFDLWFREGLYNVPEPSSTALGLLGAAWLAWARRRRFPTP
jgi:hypothetical protein